MSNWTTEEVEALQKYSDLSPKEAWSSFLNDTNSGRSYDSIQKKLKRIKDICTEEDAVSESIEDFFEPKDIISLNNSERKKHNKEQTRLWLQSLIDLAKDNQEFGRQNKVYPVEETSLCLVLSDLHFGKHTKWFDMQEANKRLVGIPDYLHKKTKNSKDINEIVVILAGDLVEGEDIYPTQNNHIECSAIEQTKTCSESLWQMILNFRNLYPDSILRVETVPGNHGRVSKTANENTNWDNVVYMILSMIAKKHNDDKIIMNCNFETFKTFKVKDKTGMANHHGVKHTGTSNMREKVAGWIAGKQFDFMVHGHWHEWHVGNWLGRFIMGNGCMCGPDDLAEQMGKEDTARQGYFFVTPNEPIWGFGFIEWPHSNTHETTLP